MNEASVFFFFFLVFFHSCEAVIFKVQRIINWEKSFTEPAG